jgi:YgiT-type zinc finger domain-containing protein
MSVLDRRSSSFTRQEYGIPRTTLREARPMDLDETLPLIRRLPAQVQILPMRCLCCQGPVERSTTRVKLQRGGCRLEWDAVPAWVCSRCGQTYFEPQEVEKIHQTARAVDALQT